MMQQINKIRFFHGNHLQACIICLVMAIAGLSYAGGTLAHSQTNEVSQEKIKALISKSFDQPNLKVKTSPIVIEGKVAIADWTQGRKGGRALLRRKHNDWEIIACGGSGFKDAEGIAAIGISKEIAANITAKLKDAEAKLSPQQVKQFDSFDGVVNMVHDAKHSPNSKH
jgi:hypothetical protein